MEEGGEGGGLKFPVVSARFQGFYLQFLFIYFLQEVNREKKKIFKQKLIRVSLNSVYIILSFQPEAS